MRLFYRLRVAYKRWLSRRRLISAYCRDCGRETRDFHIAAEAWVAAWGSDGGVLCYDHFADRCQRAGLPCVWRLVPLEDRSDPA